MNNNHVHGIPSGFAGLDTLTSGFNRSDLIIIGGRPSTAKTSIALLIALYLNTQKHLPAAFFSLEMSRENLLKRLKNNPNYKEPSEDLFIIDTPSISISEICSKARFLKADEGIEMIFIDYAGLIRPENDKVPYHEQQAEITKSLKNLTQELNIPVVVLAQLKRGENNPIICDINGLQDVEQIADTIVILFKEENPDETVLRILKNTNGKIGNTKITFLPQYGVFKNLPHDMDINIEN